MKNYMEEVAKILGLELFEEFKIKGSSSTYQLKHDGLWRISEGRSKDSVQLEQILTGELEIIKLPWKPKKGEPYYTYNNIPKWSVEKKIWMDSVFDCLAYNAGIVYLTVAEADNNFKVKYKELTGRNFND